MGKVYRPDHTAHIREELKRSALYFATGLFVVVVVAGTTLFISNVADVSALPVGLVRVLWIVGSLGVTASLVGLATVLVRWLWYLRRRADLDAEGAEGAEAIGEIYAKMANQHRRDL